MIGPDIQQVCNLHHIGVLESRIGGFYCSAPLEGLGRTQRLFDPLSSCHCLDGKGTVGLDMRSLKSKAVQVLRAGV